MFVVEHGGVGVAEFFHDGALIDVGTGEFFAFAVVAAVVVQGAVDVAVAGGGDVATVAGLGEQQVAVGAVVLNRMESELYPDDMEDVIYQSGQFEPTWNGMLSNALASGVPDYCYESAQAALDGENPVGDCLYFHAGSGGDITIGNQTFY